MNLFVYGTLTFPEVVFALTGQKFASKRAELIGYRVAKLKGKKFPGLIKNEDSIAKGLLFMDLDAESFEIISKWEDPKFSLINVDVLCSGDTKKVKTFIWKGDDVAREDWDREEFKKNYLSEYVNYDIPSFLQTIK